jgi:hypothetical protein
MLRGHYQVKTLSLLAAVTMAIFASVMSMQIIPEAKGAASYTGTPKPMEFYFHKASIPQPLGSGYTSDDHVMNTTQLWGGTQRMGPQSGAFDIYFYLSPDLAGNYPFNGTVWTHLWVNATGSTPSAVFTVTVYELSAGGFSTVGSWTSGNEDLSPDIYDVNAIPGNTPLKFDVPSYTFKTGSSVVLQITIKPGAATSVSVWYDSAQHPSHAIIYSEDYARPISVKTYAVDNSETNLFEYNWTDIQRKVIVRTNVTDPFGGYDIYRVNLTIVDPAQNAVVDNGDMVRTSDGQWRTSFSNTYEASWVYPSTAQLGNYTVKVSVIDNNGYYQYQDAGAFSPFIEYNDHIFQIGVIVYFNPSFRAVADTGSPLPGAQVYITWPNSTRDALPRYTDNNGWLNLTHVLPASYAFTILWKDVVVKQEAVYVDSDGPYMIKTEVYELEIGVLGNNGAPAHGAYVIIYTQTGVGYGLDTTDVSGKAVFQLPKGIYNVEAHYSAEYWLKVVTARATEAGVSVDASASLTMVLEEFPPPIWTTTGFMLLMALVVVSIFAAVYIVFLSRRRTPAAKKRT